jgi:stage III sporulation protein AD
MDIIKMGIVGVGAVLLALLFKQQKPEYAMLIQLACCMIIFAAVVWKMQDVFSYISSFSSYLKIDGEYLTAILKMIGITYVAEFASAICKDAGFGGVAVQIQIFAKLSILILSMPVLYVFLSTIGDFL